MKKPRFSLVAQVGIVSLVFFVLFGYLLSRFVGEIVTTNFREQNAEAVSNFLEKQVDNYLNPSDFVHRKRTREEIVVEHQIFVPFFDAIETSDVVKIRIWDENATVIHTHSGDELRMNMEEINQTYEGETEYIEAMGGVVTTRVVEAEGDIVEYGRVMEIFVPMYLVGRETPVGVAEVYYKLDRLDANIDSINRLIFGMTGVTFAILYLVLLLVTKRASDTIERQRKKVEEAQSRELARSNELNEVLRLLNKILRHDILNDLTVVAGNISTYFEYGKEKVKVDEVLKDAQKSIDQGIDLVSKMKDLESALASGKPLGEVDARKVVEEVAGGFEEIEIKVKGEGKIMADGAFSSVVDNLISNAVKHGKARKIEVKLGRAGEMVDISIADDGKGIPDEVKSKLFTEGFKYGETGNTGLGLYIVKKTVERYGGSVVVMDNEPRGVKFILKIPRIS